MIVTAAEIVCESEEWVADGDAGERPPFNVSDEQRSAPMNHSPRAQFDDVVLGDAAAVYAGLAVHRLQQVDAEEAL